MGQILFEAERFHLLSLIDTDIFVSNFIFDNSYESYAAKEFCRFVNRSQKQLVILL